ncbi:hypothetical protein BS78_06G020100 [Paspalum vaginatum]|nr:hypothetical protein BS78_06G020100 [Paspalum vaginatum]
METFLRCFVHTCPTKWSHWISLAEYWYNNSPHSAINWSPFEALYGYVPRHFGISVDDAIQVSDLSDWLHERHLMTDVVKLHLARAKNRMKQQADKHRSECVFQCNDMVFLKLQPYIQSSLAPRANQKLSFKYFGPFKVIGKVGSVAYRLQLPESSHIHPVFHVSQLKKAVLPNQSVSSTLPSALLEWPVPEQILQRRSVSTGTSSRVQVLVQWSHAPPSMATWEDLSHCVSSFLELLFGDNQPRNREEMSAPRVPSWTR